MALIDEIRSTHGKLLTVDEKCDDMNSSLEELHETVVSQNYDANIFAVYITSDDIKNITSKNEKVDADIRFVYPDGTELNLTGKVKWQGSGSIRWPDKNYQLSKLSENITFITYDGSYSALQDNRSIYAMAKTRNWGPRNKFVLKRDHMDHSHSRNTIAARLWGDVVSTREESMVDITSQPEDWNENYSSYYRFSATQEKYVLNKSNTFLPINVYYTKTDNGQEPITGGYYPVINKPEDWETNFADYYFNDLTGGIVRNKHTTFAVYTYKKVNPASPLAKLKSLANYGAIDAFPCKVYVNDEYYGLYMLGTPKDENLFGFESDGSSEGFICGEDWGAGVRFAASAYYSEPFEFSDGDIGIITQSDYEAYVSSGTTPVKAFVVEYNEDNCTWMPDSLNGVLNVVYDYTNFPNGDTFKKALEDVLDVNSAIDYLLFIRALCMPDNVARNMLMATYDGTYWFCSAYDMDTAFGIHWTGEAFYSVAHFASLDSGSYTNTTMRLWKRIIDNYPEEIKARWKTLRGANGALSNSNVIDKIVALFKEIPDVLLVKDTNVYDKLFKTSKYPVAASSGASNMYQIISWYQEHIKLLDESIEQLA